MRSVDRFIPLLSHVRSHGENQWSAQCPAHEDRLPSLSLTQVSDRVLMTCFAGCTPEAIVGALGLHLSSMFDEAEQQETPMLTQTGRVRIGLELFTGQYMTHVTQQLREWESVIRYMQAAYTVTASELIAGHLSDAYRHRDTWRERFDILHTGTTEEQKALLVRITS